MRSCRPPLATTPWTSLVLLLLVTTVPWSNAGPVSSNALLNDELRVLLEEAAEAAVNSAEESSEELSNETSALDSLGVLWEQRESSLAPFKTTPLLPTPAPPPVPPSVDVRHWVSAIATLAEELSRQQGNTVTSTPSVVGTRSVVGATTKAKGATFTPPTRPSRAAETSQAVEYNRPPLGPSMYAPYSPYRGVRYNPYMMAAMIPPHHYMPRPLYPPAPPPPLSPMMAHLLRPLRHYMAMLQRQRHPCSAAAVDGSTQEL